jgi:hypothetical protein
MFLLGRLVRILALDETVVPGLIHVESEGQGCMTQTETLFFKKLSPALRTGFPWAGIGHLEYNQLRSCMRDVNPTSSGRIERMPSASMVRA